jgi:hypothetical protein
VADEIVGQRFLRRPLSVEDHPSVAASAPGRPLVAVLGISNPSFWITAATSIAGGSVSASSKAEDAALSSRIPRRADRATCGSPAVFQRDDDFSAGSGMFGGRGGTTPVPRQAEMLHGKVKARVMDRNQCVPPA